MNREAIFTVAPANHGMCHFCLQPAKEGVRAQVASLHDSAPPGEPGFRHAGAVLICTPCAIQIVFCVLYSTSHRTRAPDTPPDDKPSPGGVSR